MTTQDTRRTVDSKPTGQARAGPEVTEAAVASVANFARAATSDAQKAVEAGMGAAAEGVRRASDQFTRIYGFDGEEGQRLAKQSSLNMDAIRACSAIVIQAFQGSTRDWFSLAQSQYQRNLNAFAKLSQARSVQDYLAIQSDLIRDSMQHLVEESGAMVQHSAQAVQDATQSIGKAVPSPATRAA